MRLLLAEEDEAIARAIGCGRSHWVAETAGTLAAAGAVFAQRSLGCP